MDSNTKELDSTKVSPAADKKRSLGLLVVLVTMLSILTALRIYCSFELISQLQQSKGITSSYEILKSDSNLRYSNLRRNYDVSQKEAYDLRTKLTQINLTCAQMTIDGYCRDKHKNSIMCTPCERGRLQHSSSCYVIVDHANELMWKTWAEARDDCRRRNADLVVIDNEEEQVFVHENSYGETSDSSGFWLGLSDPAGNGTWSWVDGKDVSLSYWTGANHTTSSPSCAITWRKNYKDPGWSAVDCKVKNRWMCEKRALSV